MSYFSGPTNSTLTLRSLPACSTPFLTTEEKLLETSAWNTPMMYSCLSAAELAVASAAIASSPPARHARTFVISISSLFPPARFHASADRYFIYWPRRFSERLTLPRGGFCELFGWAANWLAIGQYL